MNVLVAESEPVTASKIIRLIQQWGHRVEWSSSGQGVINNARQKQFDLILMDLFLPDTTSYDLITELKEMHPEIRIVAMTGNNTGEMERKIRSLGIIYYMTKPFPEKELKSILDHISK